jgi:hypothetical protein
MNVVIIVIMFALTASLGFIAGWFASSSKTESKIENLRLENGILNEWLTASRKTCEILVKECDELSRDLESVVNGGHIIQTVEENEENNTNVE